MFSDLNRYLMAAVAEGGPTVLFSTPNENSRRAYRRLAWSWLGPITHRFAPVAPIPWRTVAGAAAQDATAYTGGGGAVATGWDETSWR